MKLLKLADKFEKGKFEGKPVSVVINKGETNYLKWFLPRNKDVRLHGEVIKYIQSRTQTLFNNKFIDTLGSIKEDGDSTYVVNKLIYLNGRKRINTIFTNVRAFKNKLDSVIYDVPFGNKNNEIKVGRFVRKLFQMNDIAVADGQIEQFVTDFYSKVGEDLSSYFKVVSGEDIRKWYLEENYHTRGGSLGGSCERYANHAYNKELYVRNPEVEMLVLFDRQTERVKGRAILWRKSTINDYRGLEFNGTFMDRVYVNDSKDVALFKNYAEKNGFAYKQRQSYDSKPHVVVEGQNYRARIEVEVTNTNVDKPYLDTVNLPLNGNKMYNGH